MQKQRQHPTDHRLKSSAIVFTSQIYQQHLICALNKNGPPPIILVPSSTTQLLIKGVEEFWEPASFGLCEGILHIIIFTCVGTEAAPNRSPVEEFCNCF
ncbi:hypothetical protein MRB53_000908 [Persea americana]|uniref:Uncharacterized protein n=1 Tax=Persea americana TaxID=3435 RepID=A0ACC2MR40_PERAE|nr:hypothetical protein MRB53_000908 [Persea americana]